jgi:hypothetical protein
MKELTVIRKFASRVDRSFFTERRTTSPFRTDASAFSSRFLNSRDGMCCLMNLYCHCGRNGNAAQSCYVMPPKGYAIRILLSEPKIQPIVFAKIIFRREDMDSYSPVFATIPNRFLFLLYWRATVTPGNRNINLATSNRQSPSLARCPPGAPAILDKFHISAVIQERIFRDLEGVGQ